MTLEELLELMEALEAGVFSFVYSFAATMVAILLYMGAVWHQELLCREEKQQ